MAAAGRWVAAGCWPHFRRARDSRIGRPGRAGPGAFTVIVVSFTPEPIVNGGRKARRGAGRPADGLRRAEILARRRRQERLRTGLVSERGPARGAGPARRRSRAEAGGRTGAGAPR